MRTRQSKRDRRTTKIWDDWEKEEKVADLIKALGKYTSVKLKGNLKRILNT